MGGSKTVFEFTGEAYQDRDGPEAYFGGDAEIDLSGGEARESNLRSGSLGLVLTGLAALVAVGGFGAYFALRAPDEASAAMVAPKDPPAATPAPTSVAGAVAEATPPTQGKGQASPSEPTAAPAGGAEEPTKPAAAPPEAKEPAAKPAAEAPTTKKPAAPKKPASAETKPASKPKPKPKPRPRAKKKIESSQPPRGFDKLPPPPG